MILSVFVVIKNAVKPKEKSWHESCINIYEQPKEEKTYDSNSFK